MKGKYKQRKEKWTQNEQEHTCHNKFITYSLQIGTYCQLFITRPDVSVSQKYSGPKL